MLDAVEPYTARPELKDVGYRMSKECCESRIRIRVSKMIDSMRIKGYDIIILSTDQGLFWGPSCPLPYKSLRRQKEVRL